jgi:hypothetical protein
MQIAYLDIVLRVAYSLGQRLVDVLRPFSGNSVSVPRGVVGGGASGVAHSTV